MGSWGTNDEKTLVNGRAASTDDEVDLKVSTLLNSNLAWKSAAKGNRSSSRRPRNSVSRSWNAGKDLTKVFPKNVDIPFSESEKLGLSVLECHFRANEDKKPSKKRKSASKLSTPAPTPRTKNAKESKRSLKCKPEPVDCSPCMSDLGHVVDSEVMKDNVSGNNSLEDFSAILMLASAACSDFASEGGDCNVKVSSGVEGSYMYEGSSTKKELCSPSNRVLHEDFSSVEISNGSDSDSKKVRKTDGISSLDDRSNWDLNTSMDAWVSPADYGTDVKTAESIRSDVNHDNPIDSLESETLQGCMCRTEIILPPADPGGIGHEEKFSGVKDCKSDSCNDFDGSSCSQEKLAFSSGAVDFDESATTSTEKDKCVSSQNISLNCTENSKSSSSRQVIGLNSFTCGSLPSNFSQTLRTCTSKAVCDAESIGGASPKSGNVSGALKYETVSSGVHGYESVLAPHVTSSVNISNENVQSAKEKSVCQSTEGILVESTLGAMAKDSKVQFNNIIKHDDTDAHGHNFKDIENSYNKMTKEGPSENGCSSDVPPHVHDDPKSSRCELDSDSQYEDGELRDSDEHPWQLFENDDLELEQVDYGSDTDNLEMDLQTRSSCLTEKDVHGVVKSGDSISSRPEVRTDEDIKRSNINPGKDDRMVRGRYYSSWRHINSEGTDPLQTIDRTRVAELGTYRSERCSRKEGRNNYEYGEDRSRYTRLHNDGAQVGDSSVKCRDGSRGNHYHSSRFNAPAYHHRPSKGIIHHPTRSGSLDGRSENLGLETRNRPSRNPSPGWRMTLGRGRSVRYGLQIDGRGPRTCYDGFVAGNNGNNLSICHSHPFAKRERSFSPVKRRMESCVHRSRSRSRSPSPSSLNPSFRCRSKSPNVGSAIRMRRARSPCQRPGLLVDHMRGFKSVLRSHGSPPRSTRWISDRKGDAVSYGEQRYNKPLPYPIRRSQGRFVHQDRRFDPVDSPRTLHSRRFTDVGKLVRGGFRHGEMNDDRGRRPYRCGVSHFTKHYDLDEPVKRHHYNGRYGYDSHRDNDDLRHRINSQIGDSPRKFRED